MNKKYCKNCKFENKYLDDRCLELVISPLSFYGCRIRDIIFNGTWKCERKYKRKWWKFWIWQHELKDLNKVKKRILKFNATC